MNATLSTTRTGKRTAERKLNTKQRIFVLAVLGGANNTEAARRADYKHPRKAGCRLLTNVDVAAAVEQGRLETAMRAEIDQDWLIEQSKEILRRALTPVRALDR